MIWFFVFFLVSGFCGILYELVWLRLAMAQFGVTTPLVSIVLSMFMAGLGLGSWVAGTLIGRHEERVNVAPLRLYAICELLIGVSALVVPVQLVWGHSLLERLSGQSGISSGAYYLFAGAWLAVTLIPWCACMGATIPLAMFAIRRDSRGKSKRSFSFLYLANLAGAVAGAIVPLLFIEAFGFSGTLRIGTVLNFVVAISAVVLSLNSSRTGAAQSARPANACTITSPSQRSILLLLFLTGLTSMGMEVVWIRVFTPTIGTMVYSFALILASYLFATFAGSQLYRAWSRSHSAEGEAVWIILALLGVMPLLAADLRWWIQPITRVFIGVMPFSCAMGFLTPMLVDRWSQGDPGRAGRAYAVNVLGCILGPLIGGFLLLPLVGERWSLLIFILPFIAMAAFPVGGPKKFRPVVRAAGYLMVAGAMFIVVVTKDFETLYSRRVVLRDSVATVIGTSGVTLEQKQLLVNGVGMTGLSPITKMMAHLTLASLEHPPQNTLVICFGMGTTFRSALSWGVPATVVDLVPSVPKLFPYFHPDATKVVASPNAHVIVDDGRRFLERTSQTFDSIIVDPPPPVPAAGSSLLYSKEFYAAVKQHLRAGGIFQQWLPQGDPATQSSVARALKESFPYVRVFGYVDDVGQHYLASMNPIPVRTPEELAARMPARAAADLMEWGANKTPEKQFGRLLTNGATLDTLILLSPDTPALQDDRPINEYYFLRTPCPKCGREVEWVRQRLYSAFGKVLHPSLVTASR